MLDRLVRSWPQPVTEISIIAHSMGGLVTRSACYYGQRASHSWLPLLRHIVFLGTPHHGTPLERGGNWLQWVAGLSPYTAPLARLGTIRSAGVTDLRYGSVRDEDWQGHERDETTGDPRSPVPLPMGPHCYTFAATLAKTAGQVTGRVLGDGLVPVASALGQHEDAAFCLDFPATHQCVGYGMHHMELLDKPAVYEQMLKWLKAGRKPCTVT